MAYQTCWVQTNLPKDIIDIIQKEVEKHNIEYEESFLTGHISDDKKRKSKNIWVPNKMWIGGFIWHYVDMLNKQNFMYDIDTLDSDKFQYTKYEEGDFYTWHVDSGLPNSLSLISDSEDSNSEEINSKFYLDIKKEKVRKLSVIVQLSDPEDYEGGEVQIMDDGGNLYEIPKEKGTIIVFDSRAKHRVRKIKKGVRKSIVGWYKGPRWR